jgi:hypothetical protein
MCEAWVKETDVLVDMLQRITSGEAQFMQQHSALELRTLLGVAPASRAKVPGPKSKSPERKSKPGTRSPVRDEVVRHDAH